MTLEGQKYEGVPGRWFFIPAQAAHDYSKDISAPYSHYWMHFDLYPNTDGTLDVTETWNIEYGGTGEGYRKSNRNHAKNEIFVKK